MGKVEALILQKNWRGMEKLYARLPADFCRLAAEEILSWPRGTVLVTTGFYVRGKAETDGPPGTLLLIQALRKLGFYPVVVTDQICKGFFEAEGVRTEYLPEAATDEMCRELLAQLQPVGMIAVERCGKNTEDFYGVDFSDNDADFQANTAPIDRIFELAAVPTVGIGDGGNEIGMGKLASVIAAELPMLPCRVATDHLIVATVSNWGAIALAGCLGFLPTEEEFHHAYRQSLAFGYVDGFTGENVATEDRFPLTVGLELLAQLRECLY